FTTGYELWKSDGTAGGTVLVKDINTGGGIPGSYPAYFANVNGTLFFSAISTGESGSNGFELWRSDGTEEGTFLVKDIVPGPGASNPVSLTNVNGTLLFSASDAISGNELWKSDGTAAGTVLVNDINPGPASSSPSDLANVHGTLFFAAANGTS